jgi:hypothetical protein
MGNIHTVGPNESLVVSGNQLFINLLFFLLFFCVNYSIFCCIFFFVNKSNYEIFEFYSLSFD